MRLTVSVCLFSALSIACDSDSEKAAAPSGDPMSIGCAWKDFEATVRSGPSAGGSLRGELLLAAKNDAPDDLYGQLTLADDRVVAVRGTRAEDLIGLTFFTEDGTFEGEGAIAGAGAFCKEGLAGELVGPKAGDAGDWLGAGLVSYDNDDYDGIADPPPGGLSGDGTVDFTGDKIASPRCEQYYTDSGAFQTICSTNNGNGTTTQCISTYFVGATQPVTHCTTSSNQGPTRPGVQS